MLKRRYEILLPLKQNDGTPISEDVLSETRLELLEQFEGVSFQPLPVYGLWAYEGQQYEDESVELTVDVDDTKENRQFFLDFKKTLLQRFDQIEIYIISYPIDIL